MSQKKEEKEGAYANTMGIIHGDHTQHSLWICHFMADDELGITTLWLYSIDQPRVSDYNDLHRSIDLEVLFLEKDI
jgi:hypothetical protein